MSTTGYLPHPVLRIADDLPDPQHHRLRARGLDEALHHVLADEFTLRVAAAARLAEVLDRCFGDALQAAGAERDAGGGAEERFARVGRVQGEGEEFRQVE